MSDTPKNPVNRQDKPFLVVYNNHIANRGEPPSYVVNLDTKEYFGYFENEHGEQWVFIYDYDTETGTVRGGDAGWEVVYPVVEGRTPDLILGREEQAWLLACWEAVMAFREYRDGKRAGQR
jgi:hypothetical protein